MPLPSLGEISNRRTHKYALSNLTSSFVIFPTICCQLGPNLHFIIYCFGFFSGFSFLLFHGSR